MEAPAEFRAGRILSQKEAERWLEHCGREVKILIGARIFPPERVTIGNFSQIDEGVFIFAGEKVIIGDFVHLAFSSSISGGGQCEIQDFAGVGSGVRLITGSEDVRGLGLTNPTVPPEFRTVKRGRITIGAHALIFTNSVVLPDVVIGEGAIVSAGSIVHHDLNPWGIYAGNPLVQVGIREKERVLELAAQLKRSRAK